MDEDMDAKNGPLTLDQARELLRAVVEEYGEDYRYTDKFGPSCLYVTREYAIENWGWSSDINRGQPGKRCVVGTLLDRHGEEWHHREEFWDRGVSSINESHRGDYFTWDAAKYLDVAQSHQDRGETWGEALVAAEKWADEWAENHAVARELLQDVLGES